MAVIATFFMNGEAEASFLAQGKSWLKFFQPISNFPCCKLAISFLVLGRGGIFSCANMSNDVIIFGSVKH